MCFYQPKPFIASTHVMVLDHKGFKLTDLSGVFVAQVVSRLRPLFSFGRALTDDRVKSVSIRLPSYDGGLTPSTAAMEAMMHSLPFSGMFVEKPVTPAVVAA